MYYFEDNYYQLDDLYEDKNYSPVKQILDSLKEDEYKFGSYKKYSTQKINVVKIKKILDSISDV
jgi:hypothetical protein